uniref:Outer membrane protein beta-barrel domain-containing protein n=1 Tax=uncultured Elusimicrobia bacterium TaxID=699876 RepID=A0A650EMX5_9BACT|nr:hypothetical protein Elusimicrob2101_0650 [uncultured Elusimicrobia bacterium]
MKLIQKTSLLFAGLFCLFFAVNASAEVMPYMSLKAADTKVKNDVFSYDSSMGAKWAVGASVWENKIGSLRTELEYGSSSSSYYFYSGKDQGDAHDNEDRASQLETDSFLFNMYFDFNTGTIFTPYVGAGIGVTNASMDYNFKSGKYSIPESRFADWKMSWNIGAGVGVALTKNLTLDLGYRYSDLGHFGGYAGLYKDDYQAGSTWRVDEDHRDYDLTSHEVMVGVRYTF